MKGHTNVSNVAVPAHGLDEPPEQDRGSRTEREQGGDDAAHDFESPPSAAGRASDPSLQCRCWEWAWAGHVSSDGRPRATKRRPGHRGRPRRAPSVFGPAGEVVVDRRDAGLDGRPERPADIGHDHLEAHPGEEGKEASPKWAAHSSSTWRSS